MTSVEISYSSGTSDTPLLGDTIGDNLRRTVERVPDRDALIEHATGRPVIGFMSGNQQDPDMICEVFVLSPTSLVDEAEARAAGVSPVPTPS